jgi:hypothetical protein
MKPFSINFVYSYMRNYDIHKIGRPCIYMILNKINNKKYIGSAIGHYQRKGQHYYMLRRNTHFNSHLQSAWNKYGESNFVFKVIEFINNITEINKLEEYYITKYNANNNKYGYNSRLKCYTNIGYKWTNEAKLKFSKSKKGKKIKHLDYIKLAKLNMKKVISKNKLTSTIIIFDSIKEASLKLNIDRTCISKAVNKEIKTAGGYYWDFIEKSISNNSVNSGEVCDDNPDPSLVNDIRVTKKEQRLISEESTNNLNTSAEHPLILDDDIV